jgi:acetylornithine deacetylase/succinyl-diaminopimelate desuccinylase-like protein
MLNQVLSTIDSRQHQSLDMLKQFVRIPSVSTNPEHKQDMVRCATWVADQFRHAGLQANVIQTPGHPVVVAKNQHISGRPTVLMYGHYDVQPPEPLDLWTTPPFEPTERNGALYARGACDDKGQVWCHMEAVTAWQAHGGVPVNITLLIEGEEEIGSANLPDFVKHYRDDLKADIAVVSDTNQFTRGYPAITYGLRGLVYMEVKMTAASHDLHSGLFGGTVANPANELAKVLGSLHDEDGHVTVEGFYDDVLKLTPDERAEWAQLPFDEKQYQAGIGAPNLFGEKGFTTLERKWARPTCDINGLTSGYQGPGAKTVLPAVASAKVSMRLVPNQDPATIAANFEKTLRARTPETVKLEVHCHSHTGPVLVPRQSQGIRLAAEAIHVGFGVKPTYMREGGSIPIVGLLKRELDLDTLLIGFGLDDDRIHSPNEKFELDALHKGTRTAAALYERLAKLPIHTIA